jgi:hypothetical protein
VALSTDKNFADIKIGTHKTLTIITTITNSNNNAQHSATKWGRTRKN